MAKTQRQTILENNATKVALLTAVTVPGTLNTKVEIGRGAPDTRMMQGTTMEAVPDRTLQYRLDDGS